MAWFFTKDPITSEHYTITGEDASHIARSLRMKAGEELTLCTEDGRRHDCVIESVEKDAIKVRVLSSTVCEQEPTAEIHLFVALLKGDKFDDVVQKAVELGAVSVTPFLSVRCISRPDEKALKKKCDRWQKIADNAASQSRRGRIPCVHPCADIRELPERLTGFDKAIVLYECGGAPLRDLIDQNDHKIALITGSEGGFEEEEIRRLEEAGIKIATLGKRILRAQTAPVAALAAAMLLTGNLE
ncbi:MAG: 16S rRNA (uracil(1498)-N(3))-methyltransferase [Ruminococcus sp.]|nr:16S rRNA (uracil(1498)-N(3))-methyltransferase [Ruminococcus sp.]